MLIGIGSSVFHPESSRVARMASGGRHGLAQSMFQVGGNTGSALGPLLAAALVVALWPAQHRLVRRCWRCSASSILYNVGTWYKHHGLAPHAPPQRAASTICRPRARWWRRWRSCLLLIFSKYFYLASITSYYTFYLIHNFHVSVRDRAGPSVHLPGRGGGGHVGGRAARRPLRAQICDLALDPGRAALHPGAALRRSVLDQHPVGDHRRGAGLGLSRHRGLRAGTAAGPGGHDLRPVLRFFLRHGRHGRRGAGLAGRPDQHHLRLSGLRLPAGDRSSHLISLIPCSATRRLCRKCSSAPCR